MQYARSQRDLRGVRKVIAANFPTNFLLLIGFFAWTIPAAAQLSTGEKPELVLQTGHSMYIDAVAFSPDNRWLASASTDSTVKIWDLKSGLEFRTLRGHADAVKAVAFSPDGRLVASGSDDNTVKLWEVASGREVATLPTGNHIMGIMNVAFDADGTRLISLNQDRTVTIWDVANGQRVRSFTAGGLRGQAYFTRLTGNGQWVMSDGEGNAVEVWDVASGQRVYNHVKPEKVTQYGRFAGDMNNPTLSLDGRWLVSTDNHMSIRLWDAAKGAIIYSLYGDPQTETNKSLSFAFSPDGKILAAGDSDKKTLRLLDAATGRELRTFESTFADNLAFDKDGNRLAAIGDRNIAILDVKTGKVMQTMRGYTRSASSIAIGKGGHYLAVGSEDRQTKLWDLSLGREIRRFGGLPERLDVGATAVAFDPGGRWVATEFEGANSNENQVKVWEFATGREITGLKVFGMPVTSISSSPKGDLLAAGDFIGGLKIWETGTWKELVSSEGSVTYSSTTYVAFSPDGRWLAANRSHFPSNSLSLWDATSRDWARTSSIERAHIRAVAFSPDSKRIATSDTYNHKVDLWDVETLNLLSSIPGLAADVNGLAFSPDGRWIAGAGQDHMVRLLDTASGRELRNFSGHDGEVNAVAFTSDGHWLLSASTDGTVRIWDPSNGSSVAVLSAISDADEWVVVTPDGLFDGSKNGTQKLVAWRVRDHVLAASQFYNTHFTPGLLAQILGGNRPEPTISIGNLKLPPSVHIAPLAGDNTVHQPRVNVTVEARDEGGGIAEVRLYQDGKLAGARPGSSVPKVQYTFEVTLIPGQNNVLKALALGNDRVESNPEQVTLFFEAPPPPKPALYVLAVGINDYEDHSLYLDFAQTDAQALAQFFQSHGALFNSVNIISLFNKDATRAGILRAFDQLAEKTKPEDVALIYFAGHGVLLGPQFYFLPQDMKKEADEDAAVQKYGIPASFIGDALVRVKATKQVLLLDACQSESALAAIAAKVAFRTRSSEKPEYQAVRLLGHANGVYLLAASTAQQYAHEVPQLGHGLFTYALLAGLGERGEPQASHPQGIVTVISLINYVVEEVPKLVEEYRMGDAQTPAMVNAGTDIPLLVSQKPVQSKP